MPSHINFFLLLTHLKNLLFAKGHWANYSLLVDCVIEWMHEAAVLLLICHKCILGNLLL